MRRNKFGAIKQTIDGVIFASKREAARYCDLKTLLKAGRITDLVLHPRYDLTVNGHKIGRYTADFKYLDADGREVVEDAKGVKTRDYILRKKLVKALHNVEVSEV